MRSLTHRHVLSALAFVTLSSSLMGCPEKGGTDKTTAEPERAEPDDEGKAAEKKQAAPAAPADDAKPDEDKDKGGW